MRGSVLTICTELLIWSKKNESETDLKLRGELLDTVLSHLLDGNAHVRSKVSTILRYRQHKAIILILTFFAAGHTAVDKAN